MVGAWRGYAVSRGVVNPSLASDGTHSRLSEIMRGVLSVDIR
jgi:hypothetical protein